MNRILLTGTAGFIGYHLTELLLKNGYHVTGLDCINEYYEVGLKYSRLQRLGISKEQISYNQMLNVSPQQQFIQLRLEDKDAMIALFASQQFDYVIHLAAQAGVRYSLENPYTYIESNISGFLNILEGCRAQQVKHLIYASSSSVYGLNQSFPFSVDDNVDHPISLYAATKKSNELMAHTYSYLYNIPTTGLRFFTVYGPWGRPDMALFIFTRKILECQPIEVFNNGDMMRDFTYMDDIVESIRRLIPHAPKGIKREEGEKLLPSRSTAPYTVYNIGNNAPVALMDFVHNIEEATGIKAEIQYKPIQPGDVPKTYANVESLFERIDFKPETTIKTGISNFIAWYRSYYNK